MIKWLLCALALTANVVSLSLMGVDKARARKGAWRVRERTLWLAAICFGSLGAMAGMLLFRHKTLHVSFAVGFPALLGIHIVLAIAIGRWLLSVGG